MKRFFLGLVVTLLVTFGLSGLASAVDVNNFSIQNFHAEYYLGKDNEGRSTLKTVESITAVFPNFDQNHGIERAIPKNYDKHPISLEMNSITNENGDKINYSTYASNDNLVFRIGDADKYVHGAKTYVITYTQRDVTRFFQDTGVDEFYWDVNGTEWSQNFDKVSAEIHIDPNLVSGLNSQMYCYFGVFKSNNQCKITRSDQVISAQVENIGPYNNMTIAISFLPNTFNKYQPSETEKLTQSLFDIYIVIALFLSFLSVVLLGVLIVLKTKINRSNRSIVAEYIPPKNCDIVLASIINNQTRKWVAATYVDLAVRHNIKIVEQKGGFLKGDSYSLELVSNSGLSQSERQIVEALFGSSLAIGTRYDLNPKKPDYALYAKLKKVYASSLVQAKNDNYYDLSNKTKETMKKIAWFIGFALLFTWWNVGVLAIIIAILIVVATKPLSQKGLDLRDYLKGLQMYIKYAEEDRLKALQSPKGADRVAINTNNDKAMIKLYERVLPYAVLFGNEKEWAKVLGVYYEQQASNPDWYSGNAVFNSAVFASTISSFSANATTSSYSPPYSSSSGGSSGGGSSGGGGGGGGGGGW